MTVPCILCGRFRWIGEDCGNCGLPAGKHEEAPPEYDYSPSTAAAIRSMRGLKVWQACERKETILKGNQ